jgi:peptidyl-prolyl cis-trans isomerase A (cyclophilin A)
MDRGLAALGFGVCLALACGCGDSSSSGGAGASGGTDQGGDPAAGGTPSTGGTGGGADTACFGEDLPEEDLGGGEDPEAGNFTMDEALDGLPDGPGPLRAIIETDLGTLTCELFPETAPFGVANFVGLARGRRPFEDTAPGVNWIKGRHYYDGLKFHRVIDDFMAQTGDPKGTGFGGPGYAFDNEIGDESHTPGTLSYANSGPDTNGSQFFIVAETGATFLDGDYVIFGRCAEVDVVKALTEVATSGDPNDTPLEDLHMTSVRITRCAP